RWARSRRATWRVEGREALGRPAPSGAGTLRSQPARPFPAAGPWAHLRARCMLAQRAIRARHFGKGRPMVGVVTAVSRSATHTLSKPNQDGIRLVAGRGVAGDAHQGETVKHRSRVARDPTQPNLRQVHLIHAELHDELRAAGFDVTAGQMGE